jgi:glutaredoxin 2
MEENMEGKVVLYTTHCPMCRQLERQLGMKNIEFEQVEGEDKIKELGFNSAPILEVEGKYMNFSEAIAWIRSR